MYTSDPLERPLEVTGPVTVILHAATTARDTDFVVKLTDVEPDGASVILNGSVMSQLGSPGSSAYAASKAAVRGMSRVLASELAPRGIRVNVVSPGATRTPIWDSSAPTPEAKAALEKRLAGIIPLGRLGEADEIAKTVLFLASDDSSNLNAAEIFVDGGSNGAPVGGPVFRG